jgi:hypothetical protein
LAGGDGGIGREEGDILSGEGSGVDGVRGYEPGWSGELLKEFMDVDDGGLVLDDPSV